MKTAAVICEFNPFHNGHAYILNKARELTGADYVIAIMSGNYVQRGEPALFDKYKRTELALSLGADLVIELPQVFAVSSAMEFARAGIRTAIMSDVVDYLVFGTEDMVSEEELKACADCILNEEGNFSKIIKKHLKEGFSYPAARELAVSECTDIAPELLRTSNNILALSYTAALKESRSNIKALPVKRLGDGYNERVAIHESFASATAIRELIKGSKEEKPNAENICSKLSQYIPESSINLYKKYISELISDRLTDFNLNDRLACILNYKLMEEAAKEQPDFTDYTDVSKEISDRLLNTVNSFGGMTDRVMSLKTKQYTYSRIQRALLHIILDIKDEEINAKKAAGYTEYLRILGFRREASELLKAIKKSPLRETCPMITNTADFRDLLTKDIMRDNLYYSLESVSGRKIRSEYERRIIIL